VRESGIVIGYRAASFPFSFVQPGGPRPLGYSIDLCLGIVQEIVRELGGNPTRLGFVPVTADTRMEAVRSGEVDLECGSTTSNAERQQSVAFSPIIYVAGTKLLVKRSSGIGSYRDLGGKTLVVTSGTTNETAMKQLNDKYKLGIAIVAARDHDESYAMLADGKADAFATDDVLLYGFIVARKAEAIMAVVGDFITYEPYGIMFRKDDPLMAAAVTRAFLAMAQGRALTDTYRRWFLQPDPNGQSLNLPMSSQLSEVFRSLGEED
jgi:glutamate/aspartate transport system substrate-binding protein